MLATRILLAMAPLASAMPLTGLLALASLTPQVQQCTHGLSTTVHLPDTTTWSSYLDASVGVSEPPHHIVFAANTPLGPSLDTPLAPPLVGGDAHEGSLTISSLTEHLGQCTHALSTSVILDDTTPWRHSTNDGIDPSTITSHTIDVPFPGAVFGQSPSGAILPIELPSHDDPKDALRRGEPLNITFDLLQCRSLSKPPTRRTKSKRRRSWLQVDLVITSRNLLSFFTISWFTIGISAYVRGRLLPSSGAARSKARCSARVESTCELATASKSWFLQLGETLKEKWGKSNIAVCAGRYLARPHHISSFAFRFTIVIVSQLVDWVRYAWDDIDQAMPAEIPLAQIPVYSAASINVVMAFIRLHPLYRARTKVPLEHLRILKGSFPAQRPLQLVVCCQPRTLRKSVMAPMIVRNLEMVALTLLRPRDLARLPFPGMQEPFGSVIGPQNTVRDNSDVSTGLSNQAIVLWRPDNPRNNGRTSALQTQRSIDLVSEDQNSLVGDTLRTSSDMDMVTGLKHESTVALLNQQPHVLEIEPEHFVHAFEQVLQIPGFREQILKLVKKYLNVDPEEVKLLSEQLQDCDARYEQQGLQRDEDWSWHLREMIEKVKAAAVRDQVLLFSKVEADLLKKAIEQENAALFWEAAFHKARDDTTADKKATDLQLETLQREVKELRIEKQDAEAVKRDYDMKLKANELLKDRVIRKDDQLARKSEEYKQAQNELRKANAENARLTMLANQPAIQSLSCGMPKANETIQGAGPTAAGAPYFDKPTSVDSSPLIEAQAMITPKSEAARKGTDLWSDDDDDDNKLPDLSTNFRFSNTELRNIIQSQAMGSGSTGNTLESIVGCSPLLVSAAPLPLQPIPEFLPVAQDAARDLKLGSSSCSSSSGVFLEDSLTSESDHDSNEPGQLFEEETTNYNEDKSASTHVHVELPVVDDITDSSRSAVDFFEIHKPQDTTARWAPAWPNQYWDLDLNDWNLLTRAEPPVVSSKDIFDIGRGVAPIYSGPVASHDETAMNADIQGENTTAVIQTGSSYLSNGKTYRKKFHYRNRGQNKNPQWKQPGIPNAGYLKKSLDISKRSLMP